MKKNLLFLLSLILLGACSSNDGQISTKAEAADIQMEVTTPKMDLDIYNGKKYLLEGDLTLRDNVIIIFDDSGSMNGDKILRAKKATIALLQSLPKTYNVAVYGLNTKLIIPFIPVENGMNQWLYKIEKIKDGGTTPIGKSLLTAIKILKEQKVRQSGYGSYKIIVVTDGDADAPEYMFKMVNTAIKYGIQINTIGLDIGEHGLRKVTKFVEASSTKELTKALKEAVKAEVSDDVEFITQDF